MLVSGSIFIVKPFVIDIRKGQPGPSVATCLSLVRPVPHRWDEELGLLGRVDPKDQRYLVDHGTEIVLLKRNDFNLCRDKTGDNTWGFTPDDSQTILLNLDLLSTPELRAAALAHELIHVKHGRGWPLRSHSLVRHIVFCEEAEAHLEEYIVANALGAPHHDNKLVEMVFIAVMPLGWSLLVMSLLVVIFQHRQRMRSIFKFPNSVR